VLLSNHHTPLISHTSDDIYSDATYTSIETQLDSYRAQCDALEAQIIPLLEAAEYNGTPIPDATANSLIQQAQALLANVQNFANSL
jgi:hypothetical protein